MKVVLLGAVAYLLLVAILARKKLPELHPRRFFLETWQAAEREAARARLERLQQGLGYDYRPLVAYLLCAVVLTFQEYFGDRTTFAMLANRGWVLEWGGGPNRPATHHLTLLKPLGWLHSARYEELYALYYWSFTRAFGYLVVPALVVMLFWRRDRVLDFGLRVKGFRDHAWIYALFFGIVLIAVVAVSHTSEFANYYPFYRQASRSWRDFFAWEAAYAVQFFTLEFFFRGFLVFSGRAAMGSGVVLAMVVPYCMIHFGKPWAEALAAILAGVVLGTLALKTRSIWSGFLIHVTVAVSMDLAALLQTQGLPGGLRLPTRWNF
ncbi:MAG: CPBP family intramembrane metalloprotease [Deltaproteobacteria bacterium]|nr:CPBP family intramembrane metalloprotease [Deltaproteobacteria bacterium]